MRKQGAIAWIAVAVQEAMIMEADRVFPDETGGVLLGYWVNPGREVVITDVVGPGPEAIHQAFSFRPDTDYQEQEIARLYAASERHITYLGDWHTHPRAGAYLSRRDRRTLRLIARHPEARTPMPLMTILAGGEPWRLHSWVLRPRRLLESLLPDRAMPLRMIRF